MRERQIDRMADRSNGDHVWRIIRCKQGGTHSSHVAVTLPSPRNCKEELNQRDSKFSFVRLVNARQVRMNSKLEERRVWTRAAHQRQAVWVADTIHAIIMATQIAMGEKIMTDLLWLPHVSLRLRRCHMCLQIFALMSMSLNDFPLLYDIIGSVL